MSDSNEKALNNQFIPSKDDFDIAKDIQHFIDLQTAAANKTASYFLKVR